MKKVTCLFFLFLFTCSCLFLSCENQKPNIKTKVLVKVDNHNLKDKIKVVNQILADAVLKSDYETILTYYSEDIIIMPEFNPIIKGKEKIRLLYQEELKSDVRFHSFNALTDSCWLRGNEIYEYGNYGLSISTKDTEHPYAYSGGYFTIWEIQKDSTLLIKYMISNIDFNPCKMFD